MDLHDYLLLFRSYWRLIFATTLAFFLLGYFLTVRKPPVFEASATLTVEKPQAIPQSASDFYQYDEYYSQLAATLFADTIANWLRSPGPVVEIYEKAGLTPPQGSAAVVGRTFRVSKGQNTTVITLTVRDNQVGEATAIIETAKSVINSKVAELKANNIDPSFFTIAATPAVVFTIKQNPLLVAILGAITGFVAALVTAVLIIFFTPRRAKR